MEEQNSQLGSTSLRNLEKQELSSEVPYTE